MKRLYSCSQKIQLHNLKMFLLYLSKLLYIICVCMHSGFLNVMAYNHANDLWRLFFSVLFDLFLNTRVPGMAFFVIEFSATKSNISKNEPWKLSYQTSRIMRGWIPWSCLHLPKEESRCACDFTRRRIVTLQANYLSCCPNQLTMSTILDMLEKLHFLNIT